MAPCCLLGLTSLDHESWPEYRGINFDEALLTQFPWRWDISEDMGHYGPILQFQFKYRLTFIADDKESFVDVVSLLHYFDIHLVALGGVVLNRWSHIPIVDPTWPQHDPFAVWALRNSCDVEARFLRVNDLEGQVDPKPWGRLDQPATAIVDARQAPGCGRRRVDDHVTVRALCARNAGYCGWNRSNTRF